MGGTHTPNSSPRAFGGSASKAPANASDENNTDTPAQKMSTKNKILTGLGVGVAAAGAIAAYKIKTGSGGRKDKGPLEDDTLMYAGVGAAALAAATACFWTPLKKNSKKLWNRMTKSKKSLSRRQGKDLPALNAVPVVAEEQPPGPAPTRSTQLSDQRGDNMFQQLAAIPVHGEFARQEEAARPELRTLVVTGIRKGNFRFHDEDAEGKNELVFESEGDCRIVKKVPEALNKFVNEGDLLWCVWYRKHSKNFMTGHNKQFRDHRLKKIIPNPVKGEWYKKMVRTHHDVKKSRLAKLVFIRNFDKLQTVAKSRIIFKHINKDKKAKFGFSVRKGSIEDGFDLENCDLRRVTKVETDCSAAGTVQVHDIIQSFQLGDQTPIDVETTLKTQTEWWNEMK